LACSLLSVPFRKPTDPNQALLRMLADGSTAKRHFPLFSLFGSVSRIGCTRFGSPGIFGVPHR
jgi:hypothetical protein